MKVVIVGLGTAAFSTALSIRKNKKEAQITIIDKKKFDLQHSCGLPYALEKKVSLESLEHDIGAERMGINVIHECEVLHIDKENKRIKYCSLRDGSESYADYDDLLLDTGSEAFFPSVEGLKENSTAIKTTDDIRNLEECLSSAKGAVVIGAGAIGLETAYALKQRGLEVSIVEVFPSLFPRAIDPDISKQLEKYLLEEGIKLYLGSKVESVQKGKVILADEILETDIVIAATGVRPNIGLAYDAGLDISKFGIVVDENMRTSEKNIYAAGDCIEATNLITGDKFESQLATTAYKQGMVAGANIAGANMKYKGSISTFASVIGEKEIAACGLNSQYAKGAGFEIVIGKSIASDKPDWFGEKEKVMLKILVDNKTRKVLGCQAIGKNVSKRIDVVSTAIRAGVTADELSEVEFSYCPAVSQTYDVLQQAVDLALRRLV